METRIVDATSDALDDAAKLLREGALVALPTETVYGLAADGQNARAVAEIFAVKGRPEFNPLIAHLRDKQQADYYVRITPMAEHLMDHFWPGPLTLVLQKKSDFTMAPLASAGLDTLAVRAPLSPVAQDLLQRLDHPFVAPSANLSGRLSPTMATHVFDQLGGDIPLILDDGPCAVGLESTIIRADGDQPILLRAGGVPLEAIEALVGPVVDATTKEAKAPHAPGLLANHYAPKAQLRINALAPQADEAFLAFGPCEGDLNLSPDRDLIEAAANLFNHLHQLDAQHDKIAVAPIPTEGLGRAINDRLNRAVNQ